MPSPARAVHAASIHRYHELRAVPAVTRRSGIPFPRRRPEWQRTVARGLSTDYHWLYQGNNPSERGYGERGREDARSAFQQAAGTQPAAIELKG
jgi:hypothetical protein